MSDVWSGNWQARVIDRARRLGYPNLLEFATANPGIPFGQLFRLLIETEEPQETSIAYVQFESALFGEAAQQGLLREAVADSLVRRLRQHLGGGWNRGKRVRERRADVISQWELPPEQITVMRPIAQRVWAAIKELSPPDDWCPSNRDDPLIQQAFARVWPPTSS